jgi:hypothetical protein
LKITKGKSEAINAMTKRKNTKEQTMIYKTLHRKLKIEQTELTGNELICYEIGGNSCSTATRRITLLTNPVISHGRGKDRIVFTKNGTHPFVISDTDIL